jgi:hypothetical protein
MECPLSEVKADVSKPIAHRNTAASYLFEDDWAGPVLL